MEYFAVIFGDQNHSQEMSDEELASANRSSRQTRKKLKSEQPFLNWSYLTRRLLR
jgi:hypothetical protein